MKNSSKRLVSILLAAVFVFIQTATKPAIAQEQQTQEQIEFEDLLLEEYAKLDYSPDAAVKSFKRIHEKVASLREIELEWYFKYMPYVEILVMAGITAAIFKKALSLEKNHRALAKTLASSERAIIAKTEGQIAGGLHDLQKTFSKSCSEAKIKIRRLSRIGMFSIVVTGVIVAIQLLRNRTYPKESKISAEDFIQEMLKETFETIITFGGDEVSDTDTLDYFYSQNLKEFLLLEPASAEFHLRSDVHGAESLRKQIVILDYWMEKNEQTLPQLLSEMKDLDSEANQ